MSNRQRTLYFKNEISHEYVLFTNLLYVLQSLRQSLELYTSIKESIEEDIEAASVSYPSKLENCP